MASISLKKRLQEKRGLATIEMAIVIMLLLLLTFAVMEYGWMFFRMQQVTNTARSGVRMAVLPDSTVGDVQGVVDGMAGQFDLTGHSYTMTPGGIDTLESGDLITVLVEVPYANVQLTGLSFFPLPDTLRGRATMAKEGP